MGASGAGEIALFLGGSFAFLQRVISAGLACRERFGKAAWPADFDGVDLLRPAEPEMHAETVVFCRVRM